MTIPINIPANPVAAPAKPNTAKHRSQNDSDDKKAGHASFADVLGEQKAEDADSKKTDKSDGGADSEPKLEAKTEPKKKTNEDGVDVVAVPVPQPREQQPLLFLNFANWSSIPVRPEEKTDDKKVQSEETVPVEDTPKTTSDSKPAVAAFLVATETATPTPQKAPVANEQRFELPAPTPNAPDKVVVDRQAIDLPKLTVKAALESETAPKQPVAFKLEVEPKAPVEQTQAAPAPPPAQKLTPAADKPSQPVTAEPDDKIQPLDKPVQKPIHDGASSKQGDSSKDRQSSESPITKTPAEERALPKEKVIEKRGIAAEAPAFTDAQPVSKPDVAPAPKKVEESTAIKAPSAPAPANPANGIRLRLETANQNSPVNVHLTERGGQVHIAVRGADQQLNGVLRQELPDLLRRLDEQGLQASAWTPSDTRLRTAESNSSEFSQQQGADSGAQNFNQNAQQQNERQRESPDPEDRTMNGKPKSDWKTAWSEFDAINTTDLFGARQ